MEEVINMNGVNITRMEFKETWYNILLIKYDGVNITRMEFKEPLCGCLS